MFDIGFAELLIIAILALLVLGPERLPGAVRSVSLWVGRIRRQAGDIRREIERELDVDGIRRDLHNESILAELERDRERLGETLDAGRRALEQTRQDLNQELNQELNQSPKQDGVKTDGPTP